MTEHRHMNDPRSMPWAAMSPDQRECYQLLCDVMGGEDHLQGIVRQAGRGLSVSVRASDMATFDFDGLTRLVVLAHDRCIRVELRSSGPGLIGVMTHKRKGRDGPIHDRHPTMEGNMAEIRRRFPCPEQR